MGVCVLLLSACSHTPIQPNPVSSLPDFAYVDTLFFPQTEHHCGPAALAGALSASGLVSYPEELAPWVYLPEREGSLQMELIATTREAGRVPYVLEPEMAAVMKELAAGHPVLVLQNLGLSWYPRWHYALMVGYDLETQRVILHSGTEQDYQLGMRTFDNTWQRAGRWAMVVLPPDRLPATANVLNYLTAAFPLERKHPELAMQAYQTALQRWPAQLPLLLSLGNVQYRLGDLKAAEQSFYAATQAEPDSAAAHNNLAHVLLRQHKIAEAKVAAMRAVELADGTLPQALETLRAVKSSP